MTEAARFCEFDWLLEQWAPLTPSGRAAKNSPRFYSSSAELEKEFDMLAAVCAFAARSGAKADRVEFHLKRMPPLEPVAPGRSDCGDLFAVKKFLLNARAALRLLPAPLARKLGVKWELEGLLGEFCLGGDDETFYIADSYSPQLPPLRKKLRAVQNEMDALRRRKILLFQKEGLDFSVRDFIVLPQGAAAKFYDDPRFFIEPHDAANAVIKPVYGKDWHELRSRREELVRGEKEIEAAVTEKLCRAVASDARGLDRCAQAVTRLDLLLSKARLAARFALVRPEAARHGAPITVSGGRFLPLETALRADGLEYTPLDCALDRRVGIITGSNMGGKTVALKTLGFLQLCMQHGFFTPAKAYRAPLFEAVHFVGDESAARAGGLSSFGLELYGFMDAWRDRDRHCLILMDEFARATNSAEAAALLSAAVRAFCARGNIYSYIATHFSGIEAGRGAGFYRMKGFDGAAYEKNCPGGGGDLRQRLRLINRFMRYELAPDDGRGGARDALKVARILGFDETITSMAQAAMEGK